MQRRSFLALLAAPFVLPLRKIFAAAHPVDGSILQEITREHYAEILRAGLYEEFPLYRAMMKRGEKVRAMKDLYSDMPLFRHVDNDTPTS